MVETGWFYGTFIDPLLKSMRNRVTAQITEGGNIIDIACGTGAQVFQMADKCEKVVGIDLSESMIKYATKQSMLLNTDNVNFIIADATNLVQFANNSFDVATMSLALHQFSPELYAPILNEMKRVAHSIIIVDYSVPLQDNLPGYGSKIIEFLAGKEHHRCFRKYYKAGGLESILPENGLRIQKRINFGGNAFSLVVCNAV